MTGESFWQPLGASGAEVDVKKAGSLVGTRGGINFIEGTNVTLTVADDAGNDEVDVTIASSGGGASAGWSLVVDEDGSSLTNWTSVAGTWAADAGGFIKQTDTTAAYRALRYNTDVDPGAGIVMQSEVRFPTAATATRRAMIAPTSTGSNSGVNDPWAGLQENADNLIMQRGDQAAVTEAFTVDEDVWYTARVYVAGILISLAIDGTLRKSLRILPGASSQSLADKIMLVNFTGEVHYRNIKVWRLDGPA